MTHHSAIPRWAIHKHIDLICMKAKLNQVATVVGQFHLHVTSKVYGAAATGESKLEGKDEF